MAVTRIDECFDRLRSSGRKALIPFITAGDPDADRAFSEALGDRPVATAAPGVTASVVGSLVSGWWIAAGGSGAAWRRSRSCHL